MDNVLTYFSDMPSSHRSLLLVSGLTIFLLLERISPFFKLEYDKKKHLLLNLVFTLTTVIVNFAMAFILLWSADWVTTNHFGVLFLMDLPIGLELVLGLIMMDLIAAYAVHWIQHKVWWLWQFHLVHHTDQHLDTTSANRHHPGESVVRFVFTTLAVWVIGAPVYLIFIYQTMSLIMTQFNHANITLPSWLAKPMVWILATPDMHRVHHHYRQPYSDSNYGNIFSFWDRLFGTYIEVDNRKLTYGVDTYMNKEEVESLAFLMKLPFSGYRKPKHYSEGEVL